MESSSHSLASFYSGPPLLIGSATCLSPPHPANLWPCTLPISLASCKSSLTASNWWIPIDFLLLRKNLQIISTMYVTLAWKIPWMEEPGGLQSMGSLRVGHYWATSLSLFTFMPFMLWRRKWHPTPVFLPGESQGWESLVGCRLWGCTESDTTEAT